MEPIRLATKEEIEKIKDTADLTLGSKVLAMSNPKGESDLAVVRTCVEIDPVYFSKDSATARRMMFLWGMENILRFQGTIEYYFEVPQSDDTWKNAVEHWGATRVFTGEPMYRFKKVL